MAFGTSFCLENHFEKLSKQCKKVRNGSRTWLKFGKKVMSSIFIYSSSLAKNFWQCCMLRIETNRRFFELKWVDNIWNTGSPHFTRFTLYTTFRKITSLLVKFTLYTEKNCVMWGLPYLYTKSLINLLLSSMYTE